MAQIAATRVRRYSAVAVALLLLLAAVIALRSSGSGSAGGGPVPRGSQTRDPALPGGPATSGSSTTPAPRPSATGTDTARPTEDPGASPTSGPGVTDAGVLVRVRIDGHGDLQVTERVLLYSPVITAAVAPPQSGSARALEGITPAVVGLQMTADGQVQQTPTGDITSAALIDLTVPATRLDLRYTLTGAVKRSTPSSPGRAAVALPPVTSVGPGDLPVVVEIMGDDVLNVTCPALPQEEQLCGRAGVGIWRTPPIARDFAVVLAQVNLPDPLTR